MEIDQYFAKNMARIGTESAFEVLARARALEAKGAKIIHLEIGQPDFPTPSHIVDAAEKALREGHTCYGPSAGLEVLRDAIARYEKRFLGLEYDSSREIAVFPGAKPGIFFSGMAFINPGDEVIIPDPAYPIYESMVRFLGGKPVPLTLEEERGFRFSPEGFTDAVTKKTKLVILNTPGNPTGSVLTRDELQVIADHAQDLGFFVISDEVYSRILYQGKHVSIAQLPGMSERTILIDGFSKTYSMTGWRLGWACAPSPIIQKLVLLQINLTSCPATFSQVAAVSALEGPQEPTAAMVREFQRRRDVIVKGLNTIPGFSCRTPDGAFYAFPNITGTGYDSLTLQEHLLTKANVACLDGEGFGRQGKGHLRFSYATSVDQLEEAIHRIDTAIKQLKP